MPDSTTTNYGWTLPEVGGSKDTWGTKLNADLGAAITETTPGIDAIVKRAEDTANAALARAGGTLTGPVTFDGGATVTFSDTVETDGVLTANARADLSTGTLRCAALGSISGAKDLDFSAANFWTATLTGSTAFSFTNVPTTTPAMVGGLIELVAPGAGTITWPTMRWAGGAAPTLAIATRYLVFVYTTDVGTTWTGIVVGRALA